MFPAWLRQLSRKLRPTAGAPIRRPRTRLRLEEFEDRTVPVTNTWTGGAGTFDWTTGGNWSLNHPPTSNEDVVVPDLGTLGVADRTLTNVYGGSTYNSLTTRENLSFYVGSSITLSGNLAIDGGATLTTNGSTLYFSATSSATNQLVTSSGGGTIAFVGNGSLGQLGTSHTVSIGSGVTVQGPGVIGQTGGGAISGTWNNAGTWSTTGASTLTLNTGNTFVNQSGGVWAANSGGTLTINGNWSNAGTITNTAGTLNLGGSFTLAGIGTLTRTGGVVYVPGSLDLGGGTFAPSDYVYLNGSVSNGTLGTSGGPHFYTYPGTTTLTNVTVATTLHNWNTLNIRGDLNLVTGGSLLLEGNVVTNFAGAAGTTQRILSPDGTGTVVLSGTYGSSARLGVTTDSGTAARTLEIAPQVTVKSITDAAHIGYNQIGLTGSANRVVVQGPTQATDANATLTFDGLWTNAGTIQLSAGKVNLGGTFVPADVGNYTRSGTGKLTVTGTLNSPGTTWNIGSNTGFVNVAGATLNVAGGAITTAAGYSLTFTGGSTVNGPVTLNGFFSVGTGDPIQADTTVTGDLTVNGTLVVQGRTTLFFGGAAGTTQTIGTTSAGTIALDSYRGHLGQATAAHTVAFGAGVTVSGTGVIGNGGFAGAWVNHGVIHANYPDYSIDFDTRAGATHTNASDGVWKAVGGILTLGGAWTNLGQMRAEAVGGANGLVNLGGTFTTAGINLAGWSRGVGANAGRVNITGSLNNVGANLAFAANTGTWDTLGGTITGGTVTSSGANTLNLGTSSTLAGPITLNGTFYQGKVGPEVAASVTLTGEMELNGQLVVHGRSTLMFSAAAGADQHLRTSGSGRISFGAFGGDLIQGGASHTVTFDSGITVEHSGVIGGSGVRGAWVNHGTITADSGQYALVFNNTVGNTYTNAADGVWQAVGGPLELGGAWTNLGQLRVEAVSYSGVSYGVLYLGGTFTTAGIGSFSRGAGASAGTVNITGTLNNAGANLVLNGTTGNWNLAGGTVSGGTVTNTGIYSLALGDFSTLAGPIVLNGTFYQGTVGPEVAARVTLTGDLELNGTLVVHGRSTLTFSAAAGASQRVTTSGTGRIAFGAFGGNLGQGGAGHTVTFDPGVTVSGPGTVGVGTPGAWVNWGVMVADGGGGSFPLAFDGAAGNTYTNAPGGVWRAVGGILNVAGAWSNFGTMHVDAAGGTYGVLNLGGTTAAVGTVTRAAGANAGTVNFTGTLTNTGAVLDLTAATGSWNIWGRIVGGTVRTSGGARLVALTGGSASYASFDGVAFDGSGNGSGNTALEVYATAVFVSNNLTLVGGTGVTLGIADGSNSGQLVLTGGGRLAGSGTITAGANPFNVIGSGTANATVTIDPGVTVQGHSVVFGLTSSSATLGDTTFVNNGVVTASGGGRFNFGGMSQAGGLYGRLVNQGTVRATAGATVNVFTTSWTNLGIVVATGGGTVNSTAITPSNLSGGTLTGGTWEVFASSTLRLPAAIATNNATIRLDGGGSNVYVGISGTTDALAGLIKIADGGSLTLANTRSLGAVGTFTNAGVLDIGPGSTFGTAAPPPAPTAGLVSRYAAEGTANDSVGPNHGTLVNGATFAPGVAGQGFSLDGVNDHVSIPDSLSFRPANLTVEGWFKFNSSPGGLTQIFGKPLGTGTQDSYGVWYNGAALIAGISDGTSATASFGYAADVGVWHHVALTFDDPGNTLLLYLDGVPRASVSTTKSIVYDTRPHLFGADIENGSLNYFFPGVIDQVGIYNRALSVSEIAAIYQSQTAPGTAFNQPGGTTTVNGTLTTPLGVALAGGTLKGKGTVNASVVNTAGTVAPGNSPGFIDITGNYTQGPGGTLLLEVAGRDPDVPQYDRLRVTGTATLDGTVRLEYLDGFQPAPGDSFRVLSAAAPLETQFATHQFPAPGGPARTINPLYDATGLTLLTQVLPAVEFGYATTQTYTPGVLLINTDVVADAVGNAYLTGYFPTGFADLDASGPAPELTTLSPNAAYVAKFDPAGNLLWQRKLDGGVSADAQGLGIALDPTTGDVLFTGQVSGNVSITDDTNTVSLLGSSGPRPFVVRLTASGDVVWGRTTDTPLPSGQGTAIAVGPGGTAYVTGLFGGTVDFDPSAGVKNLTAAGQSDVFVWALNSAGNFVAADRLGGTAEDIGQGVAVTSGVGGDAVWLTGWFQTATTGMAVLTSHGTNDFDAYVLKVSPSGTGFTTSLAAGYGGRGQDLGYSVGVGADGSPVFAGVFEFSADFDTAAGEISP